MAISKRWVIQRIFDMVAKNAATGVPIVKIDDLKTCSVENANETVYSSGGAGNAYITAHSHSKRTTGTATAATFNNDLLGLITGTDPVTGATTIPYDEVITVTSDASASSFTAIGTANAEILGLFPINSDGTYGTALTQVAGAPASGEFSYTSGTKAFAFFASELADGTELAVFYNVTGGASTHLIANETNQFSSIVRLEFETLVQDACNGNEFPAKLIVYKAKLTGSWTMDVAADGEPAMLDTSFEALKSSCTSDKLFDLIIYDESELT